MEKDRPTVRDVHVPSSASRLGGVSKPWTAQDPPAVARNWTEDEKKRCVSAANAVIARDPKDEQGAVFACIRAAGRSNKLFKTDGTVKPLSVLEKEHDGVMVALFVPESAAAKVALKGGLPPEELHVTMAYLGQKTDEHLDLDKIRAAVTEATRKTPPLSGRVGGKIRFENPGKSEAAFCAVPDVPGLDRLRASLVDALERKGIKVESEHGFNPHVTLKYVGATRRDPVRRVEPVPVEFDRLTLAFGGERVDFPLGGTKKAATFRPPESVRNNARKVLRWRDEHPNEIRGMTTVGWRRASQLASGEPVSLDVVKRMAQFARHRANSEVDPEFKNEPWRDAGYVAWLGWGGTSGIAWARRMSEANKMDENKLLKVNGHEVTLRDLAAAWLEKAERFTSAPWSEPSANLSANDYCAVCLIDENPAGQDKVKGMCKLPIRSSPGAPANTNALQAVAGSLGGSRGQEVKARPESKKRAARELVRLMRAADMEPSEPTLRRAGMTKSDFEVEFEIVKADEPKRVVYGVPLRPDAPDSQGDRVSVEEIQAAAWEFMVKSQRYDEQHKRLVPEGDVTVVESFLAPVDFKLGETTVKQGSWVLASKVFSDDLWAKVQKGEINAYSIKGRGRRVPAE